jgi:hypothetical protein
LPRIWELRNNLTAYDAVYVALAEALHAPLVTRDRRIAGAPGLRTGIEVIRAERRATFASGSAAGCFRRGAARSILRDCGRPTN